MHPALVDLRLARRLHRDARAQLRAQAALARAAQRHEQRRARARAALPRRVLLCLGTGLASIPADGALEVLTGACCAYAAVFAVRAFATLQSPPPPPPVAPALPVPPPRGSVAFPYLARLERVRVELCRLLPLVAPVGRAAAEQAWEAAAEADLALRWQAARVAAVEPHRPVEDDLLRSLEDGVCCQERLLAAVADLVAASADPLATWRLQEATDALHGLAAGLRELR